ncbi:MAG: carboxypeptidase-like regulatory domain-containing protein [Lutimonas sp.]
MKLILSIFLGLISLASVAQDINRENVIGKIIVEGSDLEGITIYNSSSKKGAVTNKHGEFMIGVALNDVLEIRALAYQNIDVRVNKSVLESKKMSVFLIEEMNMLAEVAVPERELSGSIAADASRLTTYKTKPNTFYFGITYDEINGLADDSQSQVRQLERNDQGKTMVHGLDAVNIVDQLLIPLFRSEVKNKKAAGVPEVPAETIKYYLGSDFLTENFEIPEHRVEEFIRYVEDDTFDFDLLNYGHEIELLDLLSKKSETFLETDNSFQ